MMHCCRCNYPTRYKVVKISTQIYIFDLCYLHPRPSALFLPVHKRLQFLFLSSYNFFIPAAACSTISGCKYKPDMKSVTNNQCADIFPSLPHNTHVTHGSGTSSVLQPSFLCSLHIEENMCIASQRTANDLYSHGEFATGLLYSQVSFTSISHINYTEKMTEIFFYRT